MKHSHRGGKAKLFQVGSNFLQSWLSSLLTGSKKSRNYFGHGVLSRLVPRLTKNNFFFEVVRKLKKCVKILGSKKSAHSEWISTHFGNLGTDCEPHSTVKNLPNKICKKGINSNFCKASVLTNSFYIF